MSSDVPTKEKLIQILKDAENHAKKWIEDRIGVEAGLTSDYEIDNRAIWYKGERVPLAAMPTIDDVHIAEDFVKYEQPQKAKTERRVLNKP